MKNGTAGAHAAETPKKPKLTRLKIERFRNVEPCELRFGDGFNVLLGLNATGKTTLLELIVAALSFDYSKYRDEAFALEYELSFSMGTIVASVKNERVEPSTLPMSTGLQVRNSERFRPSATLQFQATVHAKPSTVHADESAIWTDAAPEEKLFISKGFGDRASHFLLHAFHMVVGTASMGSYEEIDGWERVRRFDEALDLFREVTSPATSINARTEPSRSSRVFHLDGLQPLELMDAIATHDLTVAEGNQGLSISAYRLPFLEKVANLFGFADARMEMRLERKTRRTLTFSHFRFMFEDHDGSVFRHDDLSYGQKRLLAFYYYLAASPLTVIADELVDGLHHLWIDAAIEAIGDRQAFLASQNPLLLDHLEFESAEQVASTFVTCRAERDGDGKRMIWSNLSPYDAERFFRAYQVDVKHVSEILLSKGLW